MRPSIDSTKFHGDSMQGEMYVSDDGKHLIVQFVIDEKPLLKGYEQRKYLKNTLSAIFHIVTEYIEVYGKFEDMRFNNE